MRVVIDRFEGIYAVCEDENKKMINIEKSKIPNDAKEGTVLVIEGDNIFVDQNETKNRKKRINKLINSLWE